MNTALLTIGILIALIAGFFIGRWHGMSSRSKELAEELEQKEEELSSLKSNVDEHFSETARLFTNLTEEYKSLYQHLAKGASDLSDKSFKLTLGAPSTSSEQSDTDPLANSQTEGGVETNHSEATQEDITDIEEDELITETVQQPVDYAQPDSKEENPQEDEVVSKDNAEERDIESSDAKPSSN